MLDEVWLCSNFSSNIVQHFRSRDQKYAIISCLVLKSNIVGWCWIRLNTSASNTIQHWSNTVQHHLTMLDNVWKTCLIHLNEPLHILVAIFYPPCSMKYCYFHQVPLFSGLFTDFSELWPCHWYICFILKSHNCLSCRANQTIWLWTKYRNKGKQKYNNLHIR